MLSFRRLLFQNISGREVSRGILQEKAERCVESHTLTNPVGIMLQNFSLESRIRVRSALIPFLNLQGVLFPAIKASINFQW
jgi:hypothetical protein